MKTYIVGRGESADIKLDDSSVSREHMSITSHNSRWLIRDLQSNNGTYILNEQGASEISEAVLEGFEELLLGHCRIRLSDLIETIPTPEIPQADAGQGRSQELNFSRYIRSEDGRYVRKSK